MANYMYNRDFLVSHSMRVPATFRLPFALILLPLSCPRRLLSSVVEYLTKQVNYFALSQARTWELSQSARPHPSPSPY